MSYKNIVFLLFYLFIILYVRQPICRIAKFILFFFYFFYQMYHNRNTLLENVFNVTVLMHNIRNDEIKMTEFTNGILFFLCFLIYE